MKLIRLIAVFLLYTPIAICSAQNAYLNGFSSPASIQDYTVYGEQFTGYNPPPLHTVAVVNNQLQITTTENYPNGVGTNPVLFGSANVMRSNADFQAGFTNVFSNEPGTISWSFNIANQDGDFNNAFIIWLGSSTLNPNAAGAVGYVLRGGGMVGNRMTLYKFGSSGDYNSPIIDLTNGLGTMPEMGSYKITFDPATARWSLFGVDASQFVNPVSVTPLLGTGVDATYARQALPYFGLGGSTTGLDIFDNFGVTVVPEPSTRVLLGVGAAGLGIAVSRRSCIQLAA